MKQGIISSLNIKSEDLYDCRYQQIYVNLGHGKDAENLNSNLRDKDITCFNVDFKAGILISKCGTPMAELKRAQYWLDQIGYEVKVHG